MTRKKYRSVRDGHEGRNVAKIKRQIDILGTKNLKTAESVASDMYRKEKIGIRAMALAPRENEQDKKGKTGYFRLKRQAYLSQGCERIAESDQFIQKIN